jgi:tetratricopeptide (TPR) repeat protein
VFRSNIPSRRGRAFVGREGKLDGLLRLILEAGVVVISGPPGVGKSELALELARQHRASFPGGTFRIDATSADAPVDLARIGVTHLGLEFPPGLTIEDQCDRVLTTLAEMSALLVYDNVRSFPAIERWLPPDGMPCRVAITSVAEPRDPGWTVLLVEPLTPEASVELVEALAGAEVASDYGAQLAASSGGLPVELCPAAAVLAYERRRGRQAALPTTIATPTRDSFTFVYEHLEAPARLLLHAAAVLEPQRIVRAELQEQLATALDWSELDFRDALDACLDLHVIQGDAELTMHQLFSAFVRDTRSRPAMEADVQAIRKVQREHLLDIAERLVESPVDAALATSLLGFGLDPAIWQPDDGPLGAHDAQAVGRALNEIGQFDRARPWFEHAVDSIRRGRPDGPIDHEELSKCLHSVGHCHLSVGQFEAARPWFEEAVEETRLGDLDGNVDHDSLGRSLHSVGYCFANLGQFELARPWYEESVEEKRKGDLSGRIDHRSLGASIHAVAYCCLEMGDVPAARDWYEQAVEEKKGGDAQGRVDHASIGNSMQQLGVCLAEEGDFEQARQWFERAVEEQRHGDVHGRVDHDRLGLSLFSVGHCFVAVQDRERARDRYLEAVEEMVKGDIHGRVDHDAVGRGLHEIGSCYEDLTEARRWLEQAIEEKGKGDVHGRVSWDSLGLSLDSLARCLSAAGDHAAACARFKEAVEAQRRGDIHGRVDHDGLRSTLAAAAESCRELGDEAQAAAYEADAAELAQA